MKIKVEKMIEKYGMDYITARNLDVWGITEISDVLHLPGSPNKEQYDLPSEECELSLSSIYQVE